MGSLGGVGWVGVGGGGCKSGVSGCTSGVGVGWGGVGVWGAGGWVGGVWFCHLLVTHERRPDLSFVFRYSRGGVPIEKRGVGGRGRGGG